MKRIVKLDQSTGWMASWPKFLLTFWRENARRFTAYQTKLKMNVNRYINIYLPMYTPRSSLLPSYTPLITLLTNRSLWEECIKCSGMHLGELFIEWAKWAVHWIERIFFYLLIFHLIKEDFNDWQGIIMKWD